MKKVLCEVILIALILSGCSNKEFVPDVEVVDYSYIDVASSNTYTDVNSYEASISSVVETKVASFENSDFVDNSISSNMVESSVISSDINSVAFPDGVDIGDYESYYITDLSGNRVRVDCRFDRVISGSVEEEHIYNIGMDLNRLYPDRTVTLEEGYTYIVVDMIFNLVSTSDDIYAFPNVKGVPYPEEIRLTSTEGEIKYQMEKYDVDFVTHTSGEDIRGWLFIKIEEPKDINLYTCVLEVDNGSDYIDYKLKRY